MPHSLLVGLRIVVGTRTPQHQDFADLLHRRSASAGAQLIVERRTLFAVLGAGANFDEFVRGERAVDLAEERVGEAGVADVHDRFKGVSAGFQSGAVARGQGHGVILANL